MKIIDNREITPLLAPTISTYREYQSIFLRTNKPYLSFSIRWKLRLICAGNREKLHALLMKHGFLPILGIYSPGLYLIITHNRNKLVCSCGFSTELLFAENRPKIMYIWIRSNPAINKRKANKPSGVVCLSLYTQRKFHMDLSFPSIKLSSMKFLPSEYGTKTKGVAAVTPSFGFSCKLFRFQYYAVTT